MRAAPYPTLWSYSRRQAVTAAVELAAKASEMMVETAPAAMGGGGQRPAVVCLGWRQVAAMEEMSTAEAVRRMAEAMAVMLVAAVAAVVARWRYQGDLVVLGLTSSFGSRPPLRLPHLSVCLRAMHILNTCSPFVSATPTFQSLPHFLQPSSTKWEKGGECAHPCAVRRSVGALFDAAEVDGPMPVTSQKRRACDY